MQRHPDGTLVVSATDLVGFLECDHLVTLEQLRARGELEKPVRDDPELELIRKRGFDHEQAYIARLRADGRTVDEIQLRDANTPEELRAAQAETLAAMRRGDDVIFQATFFDGRWRGHADFLVRRDDRPSDLGSWSYDVADTKLARRVKAAAIVQMCVYADLARGAPGHPAGDDLGGHRRPGRRTRIGWPTTPRTTGPPSDASRSGCSRPRPSDQPATYPEPVDHCRVCTLVDPCATAGAGRTTTCRSSRAPRASSGAKLVEAGVTTLAGAGERCPRIAASATSSPGSSSGCAARRRSSCETRGRHEHRYELIPPNPDGARQGARGPAAARRARRLLRHRGGPVGARRRPRVPVRLDRARRRRRARLPRAVGARPRAQEKAMLEAFVDLVLERRQRDPGMHVYHYGGYESGALKRLMQRHATREDEIDVLLRGHVLVNLYDHVVRQGIRASVESYSIKKLETFYMPEREGGITQAGFSVVEYERWMDEQDPAILDAIAAYNRDDCISNLLLRDWLEGRRDRGARDAPRVVPRRRSSPGPQLGGRRGPPKDRASAQAETRAREDALRDGRARGPARARRPSSRAAGCSRRCSTGIAARRSRSGGTTSGWSRRRSTTSCADGSALAELRVRRATWGGSTKSALHRYRFDPAQDTQDRRGQVRTSRWRRTARARLGHVDGATVDRARPARGHDRPQAQRRRTRTPSR